MSAHREASRSARHTECRQDPLQGVPGPPGPPSENRGKRRGTWLSTSARGPTLKITTLSRVARGQAGEKRAGGAVGVGVDAGNDAVNGGRSIARAVQLNGAVGVDHRSRSGPVRCVPRSRCHRRRDGGIGE